MGVKDVILLSLSAALVVVGAHLTLTQGVLVSYPVFMFAVAFLFWFRYRKVKHIEHEQRKSEHAQRKSGRKANRKTNS